MVAHGKVRLANGPYGPGYTVQLPGLFGQLKGLPVQGQASFEVAFSIVDLGQQKVRLR